MGFILPSRLTRQPQFPVAIDRSNPITRGLVLIWIPATDQLIKVGGATKTAGRSGIGLVSNGSTSYAHSNSAPLFSLDGCSITALLTPTNIATTGTTAVSCGNSASANPLFILGQAGGAANRVEFRTRDAANTDRTTVSGDYIPAWASGVPCVVTGTRSAARGVQNVYAGGQLAGTVAVGAASATTFDRFAIGGLLRASFALGWAGKTDVVLIHDRDLSSAEAEELAANIWQVFRAQRPLMVSDAAAPSDTTGVLEWTEADDVTSLEGSITLAATLAWTEADDSTVITGALTYQATLGWTEADDVTAITGVVLTPTSAALSWAEQDDTTLIEASTPVSARFGGFEMVDLEPTWKRALRLRAEAKQIGLDRKKRKRAEMLEKLAAKEVLSTKPDAQIETRITSLLAEWVDLAPKLNLTPVAQVPAADAYQAFMARVAEQMRRLEDEDDEHAAEMLLLM